MRVVVLCCCLLSGCSTMHGPAEPHQNPLLIASCPELGPVPHHDFGDVTNALAQLYATYHECRTAALAGSPPP